jgi:hypothetical protein
MGGNTLTNGPVPNPVPRREAELNDRQMAFAVEYVKDFDPPAAYRRAGYKAGSHKSALAAASRLLKNVVVQEVIDREVVARTARTRMDADWVVERMRRVYLGAVADADWSTARGVLRDLGKVFGCFEKNDRQRTHYTPEEVALARERLRQMGVDFDRRAVPAPRGD